MRREEEAKEQFDRIRSTVTDIYCTWNVQSRDEVCTVTFCFDAQLTVPKECVVASRQALESWLSRHIVKPKNPKDTPKPSTTATPKAKETSSDETDSSPVLIPISGIVCSHGKLDPKKVHDMKAIEAVCNIALLLIPPGTP